MQGIVFYLLDAMRLIRGRPLEEVREIAFEIGMLGQYGLDINDPKETHVLRAARRGGASQRWSCCASCAPGLQRIEPWMDIGVDLGDEWEMPFDKPQKIQLFESFLGLALLQ